MRIPCPFCGERGIAEFAYAGDASRRRPAMEAPQEAWVEYVYLRTNPAGPHREYWYHEAGCRLVLIVERDTRTHAVGAVTAAGS
jgi:sarcosine oxidase subunit delta